MSLTTSWQKTEEEKVNQTLTFQTKMYIKIEPYQIIVLLLQYHLKQGTLQY